MGNQQSNQNQSGVSREEIIENCKKNRVRMENGVTYECSVVEEIEFHSSYTIFKLKRKLDCAGTDRLRFKPIKPDKQEKIRKYGHAILVSHGYFERENFDPYFEHNLGAYTHHEVIICQSKESFEEMVDSIKIEVGRSDAVLALVETANELFGHFMR